MSTLKTLKHSSIALAVAMALTACGGGGGGGSPSTATATSPTTSASVSTPTCVGAEVLTNGVCTLPQSAGNSVPPSAGNSVPPVCISPSTIVNNVCVAPPALPPTCVLPQLLSSATNTCYTPAAPYAYVASPAAVTMNCSTSDSGLIAVAQAVNPEFGSLNNAWGANSLTSTWSQCLGAALSTKDTLVAHWNWDFGANSANDGGYVKSYPEVGFGFKPGGTDISPLFPIQVAAGKAISVSWDMTVTHAISNKFTGTTSPGDGGNILLESWVSTTTTPWGVRDPAIALEIAIKLTQWGSMGNMQFPDLTMELVTIDGKDYRFKATPNFNNGTWTFCEFVSVATQNTGTLDMSKFVDFLKARSLATNAMYVTSVELGTEISEGAGDVKVNSFSVTVK